MPGKFQIDKSASTLSIVLSVLLIAVTFVPALTEHKVKPRNEFLDKGYSLLVVQTQQQALEVNEILSKSPWRVIDIKEALDNIGLLPSGLTVICYNSNTGLPVVLVDDHNGYRVDPKPDLPKPHYVWMKL